MDCSDAELTEIVQDALWGLGPAYWKAVSLASDIPEESLARIANGEETIKPEDADWLRDSLAAMVDDVRAVTDRYWDAYDEAISGRLRLVT